MTIFLVCMMLTPIQIKEPPLEAEKSVEIEGIYTMTGNQNGKKYNGVCVIRELDSGSFHVVNVTGKTVVQGIAIRSGNNFAVSWSDGRVFGVSLYRISGKTLTGSWTQDGALNREQLKYLGDLPEN